MEGLPPEMQRARHLAVALDAGHVALVMFAGSPHRAVVRGSDPDLVTFGDMIATVGEGPAYDVLRTGRASVVEDLETCNDRWPVLLGAYPVPDHLRSLLVVPVIPDPLDSTEDVLGVVALAREHRRPFTAADVTQASRAAAGIADVLLEHAAQHDEDALEDDVDALLDPRTHVVPQAVGVLSHLEGLTPPTALRQLKTRAFTQGTTLQQVADDLLHNRS